MNLPTVIVLLVVFALVVMALNALHSGKGSCSCGEHNEKKKGSGCTNCTANCPLKGKSKI